MLERQAARERRLAEEQHGARVPVAGGDLAEGGERRGIGQPLAEVGEASGHEIALVDGVEQLDRAHDVERATPRGPRRAPAAARTTMSLRPSRARAIWP